MSPGETCSDLPARNARTLGAPTLERGSDEVAGNLIVLIDLMMMIVPTLQRGNAAPDAPASRDDGA